MSDVTRLRRDLGLPPGDRYTQDWAYELPEQYRTTAWLEKYLAAYLMGGYSPQGQHELMTLALDVCNDLVSAGGSPADEPLVRVLSALFDDALANGDLIAYWAMEGEVLEECFALTPEIRRLKACKMGG
ncbi:hypothetical protein [Pseudomonas sp. NPDC089406]|uniref:hypothetical protein n=1 Tax=Pseudomonas sp. NPDC089406 TaxID=3364463 RepID=UPI00384EA7EF